MRVLIDTNLWRYLAEAGAGADLLRASVKGKNDIVVVPAVVYETLATGDPEVRSKILGLLSMRNWARTMPEAFLEAEELLGEIRRLHPEWLAKSPDLREYRFQLADWKRDRPGGRTPRDRGFWGRLRADAEFMREASRFPMLEKARTESKAAREKIAKQGNPALPSLDDAYYAPTAPGSTGAAGPVAEAWRWAGYFAWEVYLHTPGGPHETWFLPFLDSRPWECDKSAWVSFWLEDVTRERLPRTWLRWACEFLQQGQKWSPGTPGDAQVAGHLLDADVFLSADQRLVNAFAKINAAPWLVTAKAIRTSAGAAGVKEVLELLEDRVA